MIIVLEGFDNAGKSTLAKQLKEHYNGEIIIPGGKPENFIAAVSQCISQSAIINSFCNKSGVFIFDRLTCISEAIYNVFDNEKLITIFLEYLFENSKKCKIIHCRPNDETLLDFSNHTIETHDTDEGIEFAKLHAMQLIAAYDALFQTVKGDNITQYDYKNDKLEYLISWIDSQND